jgi:hypothetical protein
MSLYTDYVSKVIREVGMEDRLTDEDDETFMRRIIFAEEDRHRFTSTPWRGGFRWFRSSNIVPIEQQRRGKERIQPDGDLRDPAA